MAEKMQEIDLSSPSNIMKALKSNRVPERTLRQQTYIQKRGKHHQDQTVFHFILPLPVLNIPSLEEGYSL